MDTRRFNNEINPPEIISSQYSQLRRKKQQKDKIKENKMLRLSGNVDLGKNLFTKSRPFKNRKKSDQNEQKLSIITSTSPSTTISTTTTRATTTTQSPNAISDNFQTNHHRHNHYNNEDENKNRRNEERRREEYYRSQQTSTTAPISQTVKPLLTVSEKVKMAFNFRGILSFFKLLDPHTTRNPVF